MTFSINDFSQVENLSDLQLFFNKDWAPKINRWGGRVFSEGVFSDEKNNVKLNHIVAKLQQIVASEPYKIEQIKTIVARIRELDAAPVVYESCLLKVVTKIRQFFGNLFYNRDKILTQLSEGEIITPKDKKFRHLVFNQAGGELACRVHGVGSYTIPRLTKDLDVSFATRTILRMRNLVVFRGEGMGKNSHMLGPCDFFGALEKPHRYLYTIDIKDGFPTFSRRKKEAVIPQHNENLSTDFTGKSVVIDALWHKGTSDGIKDIKSYYSTNDQKVIGESLFPNSGILETALDSIELPAFDASQYDLSPFKAKLVKNDVPFEVAETKVSSSDSFCPVSYLFEDDYTAGQVEHGGGLFLETHDFSQTMTPLDEASGGFVVLGRWSGENLLELIGVKIPYGFTLVVGKDCIHGDTTLKGMYMMAMTSNHTTMQTADTVFLKNHNSRKNFKMTMQGQGDSTTYNSQRPPVVNFSKEDQGAFNKQVNDGWPFYNPFSRILYPKISQS